VKFEAHLDNQSLSLEINQSGPRVELQIQGEQYEADVIDVSPGRYSIVWGGKVFDVHVDALRNGEFHVSLRDRRFAVELVDPRKLKSLRQRHADSSGVVSISSPMPGKIVRLLVADGQAVEPGQGVVVVEAMKMQNELKAPKSGTIKNLNAHEGKTVNAGEELMVIA
jgi:acetyl/propionyl-CoA carboxylase alpha subunit